MSELHPAPAERTSAQSQLVQRPDEHWLLAEQNSPMPRLVVESALRHALACPIHWRQYPDWQSEPTQQVVALLQLLMATVHEGFLAVHCQLEQRPEEQSLFEVHHSPLARFTSLLARRHAFVWPATTWQFPEAQSLL